MNHGLIVRPILPDQFVHGDNKLGAGPLIQDGNWSAWIPIAEDQNLAVTFDPDACVTFATTNAVETLIRQEFGKTDVYSKRFLAKVANTTPQGNDPHTVCEALRTMGDVLESDLPYTPDINTWEKFYAVLPQYLYTKALEFVAEFSYGHSWVVNTSPASLVAALNFSPLTAAVYAWYIDPATGYYANPTKESPSHYVMIYGYELNSYWKIWDSYTQEAKKLAWDFPFSMVKRHTIHRQVTNPSAWEKFIALMNSIIDSMQRGLAVGDYAPDRLCGATRSPLWPGVRAKHLAANPTCIVCGGTKGIQCHHLRPFHIHPELELDPTNLVTLCTKNGTLNCHVRFGHLDNFKDKWNPNVREDGALWLKRFTAKTEKEIFPEEQDTSV